LPYTYQGRECGLKAHPYCVECGTIKNLSSDRPRNVGYYINLIATLSKEFKIAQVQMRLVAQEMERCGIEDLYGIDRQQQEKLFIDIVKKFLNVPEKAVSRLLEI
jgi:hypothetical protein